MRNLRGIIFVVIAVLSLTVVGVAGAQTEEPTTEAPECTLVEEAGAVEGTVIGVDEEENTVDVETEDGCVTVPLGGDYDHPIVELLGNYFGGADAGDYADALDALDTEDGVVVSIEAGEEEGAWVVTYDDGTTATIEDEELAAELEDALDLLADATFEVVEGEEEGEFATEGVGEEIEAYHEDGIGFGVLVKIYAIAEESAAACEAPEDEGEEGGDASGDGTEGEGDTEGDTEGDAEGEEGDEVDDCAVTVEQLIEDFQNGMSIGEMFRLYGKPSLLGVGHVRQALEEGATDEGTVGDGGDGATGICNARAQGGKANANGQDVTCQSNP